MFQACSRLLPCIFHTYGLGNPRCYYFLCCENLAENLPVLFIIPVYIPVLIILVLVILFAILFLWQFPHFLAIAWMYRDDYARAGIKMLPVVEPEGKVTSQQIVTYTLLLVPVSLLPVAVGMAGSVYLVGAAVLGIAFLFFSAKAALIRTTWQARRLLLASVLYLPALFGLMVLNR